MFAPLRPSVVTKHLKRVPSLPVFLTIKLQRAINKLSSIRCVAAPSEQTTTERHFSVLTLNVQISVKSKVRALALAIAQAG